MRVAAQSKPSVTENYTQPHSASNSNPAFQKRCSSTELCVKIPALRHRKLLLNRTLRRRRLPLERILRHNPSSLSWQIATQTNPAERSDVCVPESCHSNPASQSEPCVTENCYSNESSGTTRALRHITIRFLGRRQFLLNRAWRHRRWPLKQALRRNSNFVS